MKAVSLALVASFACLSAGGAGAEGKKVTIAGCPYPGVEFACLMIKDKDGTVYNISAASPRPVPNEVAIALTGTVTPKLSLCMQGVVLDDIKWERSKARCPQ